MLKRMEGLTSAFLSENAGVKVLVPLPRPSQTGKCPLASTALEQKDEIVGGSAAITSLKSCIDRIAFSDAAVLITGETGVGKELFARRIHRMSNRYDRPLVSINCAAIPDNLIESELFGFEKGAFTGASSHHDGQFLQAEGGTVFLDEVGDLSHPAQVKLLRVLESKEVQLLGAQRTRAINIRLIAATNQDLGRLVREKSFREDLLFRLNVFELSVPPLRDRREDIPLIAEHFLAVLCARYQQPTLQLAPEAKAYLKRQPWFGNVRELRNTMERIVLLAESEEISEDEAARLSQHHATDKIYSAAAITSRLPRVLAKAEATERLTSHSGRSSRETQSSRETERNMLIKALTDVNWNKSKAAKLLRCSRMTIHRKVVQYHLNRPETVGQ